MEQIGISEEEKSFLLGELLTVGSYLLITFAFDVRHPNGGCSTGDSLVQ